jgi:hypothetical protein
MNHNKRIFVYNPISGAGHLDSWNALVIKTLLEIGYEVISCVSHMNFNNDKIENSDNKFIVINNEEISKQKQSLYNQCLCNIWNKWRRFCEIYLHNYSASQSKLEMFIIKKMYKSACRFCVHSFFKFSIFIKDKIYCRVLFYIHTMLNVYIPEKAFRDCIVKEKKVDLIFNMYLDHFDFRSPFITKLDKLKNISWAGICFDPSDEKSTLLCRLKSFKGMCFLDDQIKKNHDLSCQDKVFGYLPDTTITDLPSVRSDMAHKIVSLARGRKIVFMGGSISYRKNVKAWSEIIVTADPEKWFFLQAGKVDEESSFNGEWEQINKNMDIAQKSNNVFVINEYIEDEKKFNELISISDFIFSVYIDFRISSNMLIKAASFKKPILVSERFLMGKRVNQYGIGVTTSETDSRRMLEDLNNLVNIDIADESFELYASDFSHAAFARSLDEFIKKCLSA